MKTEPNDSATGFAWSQDQRGTSGLTKREHFAGLAMQGLLQNYVANGMYGNHPSYPMVEAAAVRCADQLINELNRTDK